MNTKHPLYKEKKRIERELDSLYDIQRNQNWIPLEKPYKNGYRKVFDIREDIKNRDDAWVFYKCIELVGVTSWSREKSFKKKIKKGKYEYVNPVFGYISEKVYQNLHPAVKKYFHEIDSYNKNYSPYWKRYACHVPSFYFIIKTKPHYVTHYKEHDAVIERQIAELDDYLDSKPFWSVHLWRGYSGAPKDARVFYSRSDRRHSKQTLKNNIDAGDDCDKYEYRYNHRHSARWDYW